MNEREKARFRAKVDASSGPDACHPWLGCVQQFGYGRFLLRGKIVGAHRVAFFLEHGRWPDPCACHRCDNRACCNAKHLFEGTQQENIADMSAKGRRVSTPGERNGRAKLSEADVREIRRLKGVGCRALALRFGVSHTAIKYARNGTTWANVAETEIDP